MPAYLPKMIVILKEGLPLLPNGKTDYGQLKSMAEEPFQGLQTAS